MTLFWANCHYHLSMQFKPPKVASNLRSERRAEAKAVGLEETHQLLKEYLFEAQARQYKYAGRKAITCKVGERVWL